MKKNSLSTKGLSLSQAQSISNLCNQRSIEIENELNGINNCSKSFSINSESYVLSAGKPMPANIVELIEEKAKLHACQAFLMENIKAKEIMLKNAESGVADISNVPVPQKPTLIKYTKIPFVNEDYGWDCLSASELNEYYECESYAAHIGQFIHNKGILDNLRKDLNKLPSIEWIEIVNGVKTPVTITPHHTSTELHNIHEKLATIHRKYEQRVNYFKSKVKNLVTQENLRISKLNTEGQINIDETNNILRQEYDENLMVMNNEISAIKNQFEIDRQERIREISAMRISVDSRFSEVIDHYMNMVSE